MRGKPLCDIVVLRSPILWVDVLNNYTGEALGINTSWNCNNNHNKAMVKVKLDTNLT